jgi:beta-lactamase regulating signal transducer with metallopeptidase domain
MLYALLLSAAATLAAWAAEHALRLHDRPGRAVWGAALLLSAGVPAFAALAVAAGASSAPPPTAGGAAASLESALAWLAALDPAAADWTWTGPPLLAIWAALSAAALGFFGLALGRAAQVRRRWPAALVEGEAVRIADRMGPAVLGVRRPFIVLPRWILGLESESLALVVRHEREHLAARDTLLLAAGYLGAAALPWNPLL